MRRDQWVDLCEEKKNVIHVSKDGRNTKPPLTSLIVFIKAAAFEILIYCISL